MDDHVTLYSLSVFRGQPHLWDSDVGGKHIVYEAFTADGACLPPVIFVPKQIEKSRDPEGRFFDKKGREAYVVWIPGLGAPSTDSTVAWLEHMTSPAHNYFEDKPHVILDSLKGHFAENTQIVWDDIEATLYRLPAGSGKWLNPVDQSINREIRRTFIQLQQTNRRDKLANIIEAYYSVRDESVKASFHRCGIFEGDPEDIVSQQASQGFSPTSARKEACERYEAAFTHWIQTSVRASSDVLPRSKQATSVVNNLDGDYWNRYAHH